MTTADRIKNRREELGLSQDALAKRLGLKSRSSITRIEKSGNDVSLNDLYRIARALDCSTNYLMGWKDGFDPEAGIAYTYGDIYDFIENPKSNDPEFERLKDIYNKLEDKKALLDYAEYLAEKERR